MQKDIVAIIRSNGYDNIPEILHKGIEAVGGLPDLVKRHVVIKPNLCSAKSSHCGATTHVDIVREIIKILNSTTRGNCEISVVESDAEGHNANYVFDALGYRVLENEFRNVKLVNLSKERKMHVVLKDGKAFDLLEIPKSLISMEYLISVTKLKTHVDQRMSCSLKNQFGLIPKKHKAIFHPVLSEAIYDLNSLYMPDLCIVDGIVGMEGFGPTDGTPKRANVLLIGTNPIATDIVAAKIIGFKPKQIPHLKFAMKKSGYKENGFSIVGEKIRDVQTKFHFIPLRHYLLARFGLHLQKWSLYLSNFGEFLQKVRSVLSLVGFNVAREKVTLGDMIRIAKKMIFRLSR